MRFLLALLAAAAYAQPGGNRLDPGGPPALHWQEPCTLVDQDGKTFAKLSRHQCDFALAAEPSLPEALEGRPLKEQQAAVRRSVQDADRAHEKYEGEKRALLEACDPKQAKSKRAIDRVLQLTELRKKLDEESPPTAEPFGSKREYLEDYMARLKELDAKIEEEKAKVPEEDKERMAAAQKKLLEGDDDKKAVGKGLSEFEKGKKDRASLEKMWTGREGGDEAAGKGRAHLAHLAGGTPQEAGKGADAFKKGAEKYEKAGDVPRITAGTGPEIDRKRGERGLLAGGVRFWKEEVALRACGNDCHIVGDPYKKQDLVFVQKGETCVLASEQQLLKSRGHDMSMDTMKDQAFKSGMCTVNGCYVEDAGNFAKKYGYQVENKTFATPRELEKSIRNNGDAIVSMSTRRLWDDDRFPDSANHMVYVTGMVQDRSTGEVKGYFINDTGTGEGARLLWKDEFMSAWNGDHQHLVAVSPPADFSSRG